MSCLKTFFKWYLIFNVAPLVWIYFMAFELFNVMGFTFNNIVGSIIIMGVSNAIPSVVISLIITLYSFLEEIENESRK